MSSLSELLPGSGLAAERLLLREFSHRIDEELASAISLISAAAIGCTSNEARAALTAVQHRLQGHARVHQSLQMPEYTTTIDLTAYLSQLCRAISCSKLASQGIELSLSVYPLRLSSERCWLLGMIVFELVTDAARHAFHEGTGSIHVEVRPAGDAVECCITDNGALDASRFQGQGHQIIEALAAGLHAAVDMQSGPNGTRAIVQFPHNII